MVDVISSFIASVNKLLLALTTGYLLEILKVLELFFCFLGFLIVHVGTGD